MKTDKFFIYRDKKYGFTLQLPERWKHYCVIDQNSGSGSDEYELRFNFKYEGQTYSDILNISVYPMSLRKWVKEGFMVSPLNLVGEHKGRLFVYTTPEKLPSEFLDTKTGDFNYIRYGKAISMMKQMMKNDIPHIVRTFRIPK